MHILDHARDRRTIPELEKYIIRGNVLGRMAVRALATNLMINRMETVSEISWQYFDEEIIDEFQQDFEAEPDAEIYIYGDPIPLEVKCYPFGVPNIVFVRPVKMFRTIDGWLYVSTDRQFAVMPFAEILRNPLRETPEFGGKQTHHIKSDSLVWHEHGIDVFPEWKKKLAEAYRNS